MSLEYNIFKDIKENNLQQLVDNSVPEETTIEYKEALNIQTKGDKKEFLADISAFANTQGGCIIYGMREEKGVASELCGITLQNPDAEKQKIDNLIRDGIDPKIYGTEIKSVKLSNGKHAIVIWIPRSFNPPHMVTIDGHRKFYGRKSSGKDLLSVEDLRVLFGLADEISKRTKEFCCDRIFKIKSGQTPIPLLEGPKYILHLIPFGSFRPAINYDLSAFNKDTRELPQIRRQSSVVQAGNYNFDGFVAYYDYNRLNPAPTCSYTQIFRNGIIEAVNMEYNPDAQGKIDKIIDIKYEGWISQSVKQYLTIQQKLGMSPPIFVILTFLGIKGISLGCRNYTRDLTALSNAFPFTQDDIILPEVIFPDFDNSAIEQQMHQVFDIVLNAASITRENIK